MQSILQNKQVLPFPDLQTAIGPLTQFRQRRMGLIYALIYAAASMCVGLSPDSPLAAMGHSAVFPGAGFLGGWTIDNGIFNLAIGQCLLSLALMCFAGFLWFATGNVILPPVMWALITGVSFFWRHQNGTAEFTHSTTILAFSTGPAVIAFLVGYQAFSFHTGKKRRAAVNTKLENLPPQNTKTKQPKRDELSLAELKHMRLLLDRALQPVDDFEGFEWLDQFQTAAVRYQINFISYALSLAQYHYTPAFTGYMFEAQTNLKAKQENRRIWNYWKLENIWGNLRLNPDPIIRDNIMYSGFVGAQLAYARSANPRGAEALGGLKSGDDGAHFNYSQKSIIECLVTQYEQAQYGLLSCEPNWVYPLCNAITATAIVAQDAKDGSQYWEQISGQFTHALETEFTTPSGHLIPFRSNYTGFAPPKIGGAVMQAFPCFFLNAVLPDIARRQWTALQLEMKDKNWRKALWPADVGNYNISRASSYGAAALAAREMGDDATADLLVEYLNEDCPLFEQGGITHHSKASLWANANAFMARINHADGLRDLVTKPLRLASAEPYLEHVDPQDVLIAKARAESGALMITAYPCEDAGVKAFTIAGLKPGSRYQYHTDKSESFTANSDGRQILQIPTQGRTTIIITPIK